MLKKYDYIFAGGGLSGLSLLYYILQEESLKSKEILVIDCEVKNRNDKTWCFWEKEPAFYEPLIHHSWKKLQFESPTLNNVFKLEKYEYKLIKSIDYYRFITEIALKHHVQFITEPIISMEDATSEATVRTSIGEYRADYIFNSTGLFNPVMDEKNTLLQHFVGWFIETDQQKFDPDVGTLMDFTIPQTHGISFMYVLPTGTNKALVEFTLFSERVLKQNEYEIELRKYIEKKLKISQYTVVHNEFGAIPMSKAKFHTKTGKNSRIINIGTAGGYTKASTGYTFKFVHKKVSKIARLLGAGKKPILNFTFREHMFHWYDMTLLDVLLRKKLNGERIFTNLFKYNDPESVLAFLTDESGHWEEFKIRNSVPLLPFMSSGIKELLRKIF